MGVIVAERKIEVVSGKHTWLEAIHRHNMARKVMVPNSAYNNMLLGKDESGKFKPIPEEILNARPLYTGTAGVIGDKGKPLGKRVETECNYEGQKKTAIFEASEERGLVDTAILCDHAFASDGTPSIQLFNARTGKPISTREEMLEASEVIVKFNGKFYLHQIQNRDGGVLEAVGDEFTRSYISDSAVLGLVARADYWLGVRRYVFLDDRPSLAFGVAVEAASGGAPKKLQVDTAPEASGILVKGVTLDEFRALVGDASADLQGVLQTIRPEKLAAVQRLLQALDIKE
jgi:hypothetical protein